MSSREYKPPEGLQTAEVIIPNFALDSETQARIERTKKEIRTLFEEAAKIPADTNPAASLQKS